MMTTTAVLLETTTRATPPASNKSKICFQSSVIWRSGSLNAMLAKETVAVQCGVTDCQSVRIGPVALPSIGVEAGF
jgi:hypothetical protein